MPYARREYIAGAPQPKITKFTMGNPKGNCTHKVSLIPLRKVQIRHNALEALRIAVNKQLAEKLGDEGYCLRIKSYPHIILRENKMMAFAGADRLQEGMRRAFGKPVGLAARAEPGKPIVEVKVYENGVETAKKALKIGASKLPTPCTINISAGGQAS
jgi:large subunit ribosomal protein L10e